MEVRVMYQKVVIVGYLGTDPEMRYTPEGVPVTSFRVAVNRRWTTPEGEPRERTTWFRVTAWRRLAETCNEFLRKGRLVLVEGELEPDESGNPRTWVGNDGKVRASYEVTARRVLFLGPRQEEAVEPGFEELPEPEVEAEEEIPF